MNKRSYICLLTSARVFEVPYGEGRFTITLAEWLANHDQNVIVMGSGLTKVTAKRFSKYNVTVEEKKDTENIPVKKIRAFYPPYIIYMLSRLIFTMLWVFKIISMNRSTPIRLIHVSDTGYAGLAAVLSGRLLHIPVIVSSHGIRHKTLETKLRGTIARALFRFEYGLDIFTINHADILIALNSTIKNYFQKLVKTKIEIISGSIKLSNFGFSEINRKQVRSELGLNDETKIIGYVGRLAPEKNLFSLISAFVGTPKENLLKLVLVGTGHLEKELRLYVKEKNIEDKVIFLGRRNDIGRILSCFDIFILPSYVEGVSRALLEAMASSCAIICSDIPGNRELIKHNQEGLLVNPHNIEEIQHTIQLLVSNNSLRLQLGRNAKNSSRQYDEDSIFFKILQLYETYQKRN